MREDIVWTIGGSGGRAAHLIDNYMAPATVGRVIWHAGQSGQTWPRFHPSPADPEGGYRAYPYTIRFAGDSSPAAAYLLRVHYLVIAPRLSRLGIEVNGTAGQAFLRPAPAAGAEIAIYAGLHTSIYAEGVAEITIPGALLRAGDNEIVLTALDDGPMPRAGSRARIDRLDRMATGAGFIYRKITFSRLAEAPQGALRRVAVQPTVLYRQDSAGDLRTQCRLLVETNGRFQPAEWSLTLAEAGREMTLDLPRADVPFGHLSHDFELFDGAGTVVYRLAGRDAGRPFRHSGEMRRRRKWQVYITPHAHTDIGFTHRQWEVAERLCRNIDAALAFLRQDAASFAYHLDASWALETYLQTRDRARIAELIEQIKAGKVSIPANYAILLSQFAALEDLIRNHEFSHDFLHAQGTEARFAAVVDVPSLSSSLPALLAGSGVPYLVHAANQDRGPSRVNGRLHRRSPFYWQGTDGSRVLVWFAKMYCELRKVCGSPPLPETAVRGLELWLDEFERDDYAPDAVLLYGQEADNTDLDPQPIDFVRRWNAEFAYPRLVPAAPEAFFDYVATNFGAELATLRGDGGAYWEDGVLSSLAPTMQARQAQAMLPAAERLEALAVLHHDGWAFPAAQFDAAWRQLLLYDEHTWGAFLSGSDPGARLAREQWAVKEQFAQLAGQEAQRLLHTAVSRHSLSWNTDGREVVVYNPHSWPVSGPVTVEIGRDEQPLDPHSGAPLPVRVLQTHATQAEIAFRVDELPGLSFRRYPLQVRPAAEQPAVTTPAGPLAVLENAAYRLSVDTRRGCAVSWFDKRLQRELVDPRAAYGLGQFLYAAGGEGTRLLSNQADLPDGAPRPDGRFDLHEAALAEYAHGRSLTLRGAGPAGPLAMEWSLPHDGQGVDIAYQWQKEEQRGKEAAYIAFPTALAEAEVLSDSQLGWVNWAEDRLPGACQEWLPLQTGVLLREAAAAVFIASPDIPLFCAGDVVQGRWPVELDLRGGHIFSYVLNNYWQVNYKAAQGGALTFRYRLSSAPALAADHAFRLGWQARQPLIAQRISLQEFRREQPPYDQRPGGTLARVTPPQVILSTLKQARRGGGFIARLQETSGQAQTAVLAFPGRAISSARLTDLLERPGQQLAPAADGSVRVALPPWGLQTVEVEVA